MARFTGDALLAQILQRSGLTLSDFSQRAVSARLQYELDRGHDAPLTIAAIATKNKWGQINGVRSTLHIKASKEAGKPTEAEH